MPPPRLRGKQADYMKFIVKTTKTVLQLCHAQVYML